MWRAVCPVLFVRGYLGPQPILNRRSAQLRAHGLTIPVTISRPPIDITVRCLAQPRKKLPDRSVNIFCSKCKTKLYKYAKGGTGSLVKCYVERITHDYTNGDLTCPNEKCGSVFA
eukprot:CAMPEP_0198219514 /NCGR_PEP_ID=MMETSP1445-20131203/74767_1 /TAXON_ID=36898 /ORGANISM="Pyramimonas sp., Strain CCMP2087" /LENGTH=114 /DNA_ID=CAMNT_0043896941 /DNA_START=145 /DNA_END=486 /DNA_ORIENTATION=-